jgi:hypothetical protein
MTNPDEMTPQQMQSQILNQRQIMGEAPTTSGPQGFDTDQLLKPSSGDSGVAPQRLSSRQFGSLGEGEE